MYHKIVMSDPELDSNPMVILTAQTAGKGVWALILHITMQWYLFLFID